MPTDHCELYRLRRNPTPTYCEEIGGFSEYPRQALPVPVVSGAKVVHVRALGPADVYVSTSLRAEQIQDSNHFAGNQEPTCRMKSFDQQALNLELSLETSPPVTYAIPPEQAAFTPVLITAPQTAIVYTQTESPTSDVVIAARSMCLQQPESKKHQTMSPNNSRRLRRAAQETPQVVNPATPERYDPFSKHAEVDLKLFVEHPEKASPKRRSGRSVSGPSATLTPPLEITTPRTLRRHPQAMRSCCTQDEDEVQHAPCNPTLPPQTLNAATTVSALTRQDIAVAAGKQDRLHQAGLSTGRHSKLDTTKWAINTDQPIVHEDGLRTPRGYPSTPQLQVHPPSLQLTLLTSLAKASELSSPAHISTKMVPLAPKGFTLNLGAQIPADHSASLEKCLETLPGATTTPAMIDPLCKLDGRGRSRLSLVIPSPEKTESECSLVSPGSDGNSDDIGYETPMTTPSPSPTKNRRARFRLSCLTPRFVQLDGEEGSAVDEEVASDEEQHGAEIGAVNCRTAIHPSFDTSENLLDPFCEAGANEQDAIRLEPESIDSTVSDSQVASLGAESDVETSLSPASPAKRPSEFPFPVHSGDKPSIPQRLLSRYPGALLRHCERNATLRQRHLMASGIQTPDRFIPSRTGTPSKETFLLARPKVHLSASGKLDCGSDPFGPVTRRSLRMVEQYATVRNPPSTPENVGLVATQVPDARYPSRRATSAGTVWTVGGTIVTEGVASIPTGRGGSVTSGTSAAHYTADFLRRNSPSEEEVTHGKRLALAMDIDQSARMFEHSSPSLPGSPQSGGKPGGPSNRIWRDGCWESEDCTTPPKKVPKKNKDVPIIPFRVLDAPALRDDYYCSLLAYSQMLQCLAVGLGPHVYLWTESRGTRNIPDSLTAPYGSAHITSVSFSSNVGASAILAIGRADGRITLWSPLDRDPRFDSEQPAPVSCVSFRPTTVRRQSLRDQSATTTTEELLVGDEAGYVYYYSIEWPTQEQRDLFDWHGSMTLLARMTCHTQQVCGIAWSPNGEYFGTGGNDNQLFLFESKKLLQPPTYRYNDAAPTVQVRSGDYEWSQTAIGGQGEVLTIGPGQEKHVLMLNAAVKAIAFAPWQSSLLAAGGGSNDRCIHFFHTRSGASLATIDCHAQVTSLVWSEKRKEIATTFGFAQPEHPYRVAVFTWPSCNMVVKIPWWSEERALFAVAYPRGPTDRQRRDGIRAKSGATSTGDRATSGDRFDSEGRPWYGKRTKEEGCLVVATSDASIKFHEIWAEQRTSGGRNVASGVLGGSQILEEECSGEVDRWAIIR